MTRYVFENEDDAKAVYNYYDKNYSSDYYEFYVVGNVVYKHDISSYYDTWDAKTGTTYFYKDCNYWYRPYDIYEDYAYYMYYSIPITSDDFNVDSDDALYYSSIEYGSYQCYEEKDVTLHVDISSQYFDLSVYDYTYNSQYMVSSSGTTRVDGTTVLRFTIDEDYDYDIGDYVYVPIVQEFVFDGDLCTVTQYTYAASEEIPYDINLDNYSKKNAEDTLEYTFDLSKTVN